jgi:glyoxylase-like metal-dependent hydrolase (beta-lactamase superfamily II)
MTETQAIHEVRYRWRLLRAGTFRLDGGSMFGLVPRAVWARSVPQDERGRITVQQNCLLLESDSGEKRHVLIEVGIGNKLDPKSRDIFALEPRSILESLQEVNCSPDDITAITVSHLHFDHAGGLTRVPKSGEVADWKGPGSSSGSGGESSVKRTFPNARVFSQARELSDALANRSVMTRTYFHDHLEPVREQMVLVDSTRPFVTGYTPDRNEMPALPLELRLTPILPGIAVFLVPGHTWGQQATMFTDTQGRTVVFTPDVMPTAAHLGAAYSLSYDVEPYTSMISRHWFLSEAADRNWLLVLDHEPGNPVRRVRRNGLGWFDLVEDGA